MQMLSEEPITSSMDIIKRLADQGTLDKEEINDIYDSIVSSVLSSELEIPENTVKLLCETAAVGEMRGEKFEWQSLLKKMEEREPEKEERRIIKKIIDIGYDPFFRKVSFDVSRSWRSGIFGLTGMGKTSLDRRIQVIAHDLGWHNILLNDIKNEYWSSIFPADYKFHKLLDSYGGDFDFPHGVPIRSITPRWTVFPYREEYGKIFDDVFYIFSIGTNELSESDWITMLDIEKSKAWGAMDEISRIILDYKRNQQDFTLEELQDRVENEVTYQRTKSFLSRKIRKLRYGNIVEDEPVIEKVEGGEIIDSHPFNLDDFFKGDEDIVVNWKYAYFGGSIMNAVKAAYSSVIMRNIMEKRILGACRRKQHLMFDEVQEVSSADYSNSVDDELIKIAGLGRFYNVSLTLSGLFMSVINNKVLSQLKELIIFRDTNEKDLRILASVYGVPIEVREDIKRDIDKFEAYIISPKEARYFHTFVPPALHLEEAEA